MLQTPIPQIVIFPQPARDRQGYIRALASRLIDGELIGPFRYDGVRRDDPNDTVPHQDRRELRGLAVFSAWLNHTDAKSINTVDAVVEEGGRSFVKHYLIDFGATLGSDSLGPKDPRVGSEHFIDLRPAGWQAITFGLTAPSWMRANFPRLTGVGNFEADRFDPIKWKSNYPNPAFVRMDEDDAFWAARQLAMFSDDEIRALVSTGEYSNPAATEWIISSLIKRRDRIVQAWTRSRLPVDDFRVEQNRLVFRVFTGEAVSFTADWSAIGETGTPAPPLSQVDSYDIGAVARRYPAAKYLVAELRPTRSDVRCVRVYVRRTGSDFHVVGVTR